MIGKLFTKFNLFLKGEPIPVPKWRLPFDKLFGDLSKEQWEKVRVLLHEKTLGKDQVIIKEGDKAHNDLYVIKTGQVEIYKTGEHKDTHVLAILEKGDCFGESALLDEKTHLASVRALEETQLIVLDHRDLHKLAKNEPNIYVSVLKNLGRSLRKRLRYANETTVSALEDMALQSKDRINSGIFIAYAIFLLSAYNLASGLAQSFVTNPYTTYLVNVPLITLFTIIVFIMMLQTGRPLKFYGFTLENWPIVLRDSLIWTGLFIIFLFVAKKILITTIPSLHGNSLISVPQVDLLLPFLLYILFVPFQEVIARGALQSSMMYFLPDNKWRMSLAVLISAMVFATIHIHLSITYAIAAFIPGLFWGYLYCKHHSLLGVIVSHMIIGVVALFLLDFIELFYYMDTIT